MLFKKVKGSSKQYYACSACRNHKECNFYVLKEDVNRASTIRLSDNWKKRLEQIILDLKKRNPYKKYFKILLSYRSSLPGNINEDPKISSSVTFKSKKLKENFLKANYCYSCSCLFTNNDNSHLNCKVLSNLTYDQLLHPTEIVIPKTDTKTHAQYFFSKETATDIVTLLKQLNVSKILCIGAPRIHELVSNNNEINIKSIMLDIDKNYVSLLV